MSPEEQAQAALAAAAVLRHDTDVQFLRSVGIALEAESARRRTAELEPLDTASAAAFIAALPQA